MQAKVNFSGIWCPSVLPFDSQKEIKYVALEKHFKRLESAGIDFILLMGSIGEFPSLSFTERQTLLQRARSMTAVPLVANISSNCVKDMVELGDAALSLGYAAVMILPHSYFQQTPGQLLAYYRYLGNALKGPWFAYNFPARTGCDLSAGLITQLAQEFQQFSGVKDTVDCLSHTRDIINRVKPLRPDFAVLAGYDEYLIPTLLAGGDGVISGLNNIVPELFVAALSAWHENATDTLNKLQRKIGALSRIYQIGDDFVTTIKTAVARQQGYMTAVSRNFGGELDEAACKAIDSLFAQNSAG